MTTSSVTRDPTRMEKAMGDMELPQLYARHAGTHPPPYSPIYAPKRSYTTTTIVAQGANSESYQPNMRRQTDNTSDPVAHSSLPHSKFSASNSKTKTNKIPDEENESFANPSPDLLPLHKPESDRSSQDSTWPQSQSQLSDSALLTREGTEVLAGVPHERSFLALSNGDGGSGHGSKIPWR